ncbi:MAG: hypothetical protein JJE50_01530 [Actinomycetales bacterium]|nr:hypothetical protein [Actinomycetales bacterium]
MTDFADVTARERDEAARWVEQDEIDRGAVAAQRARWQRIADKAALGMQITGDAS